jgi:hypothetical protein
VTNECIKATQPVSKKPIRRWVNMNKRPCAGGIEGWECQGIIEAKAMKSRNVNEIHIGVDWRF